MDTAQYLRFCLLLSLCLEFTQRKESIVFIRTLPATTMPYKVKFNSIKQAKDVFDYLCKLVSEQVNYISLDEVIEKISSVF